MKTSGKMLFGGALIAAGMTCGSAQADFNFTSGYASLIAEDNTTGGTDYSGYTGSVPSSHSSSFSYSYIAGNGSAYAGATSFSAEANATAGTSGGNGYIESIARAYLNVSETTTILATWDFTNLSDPYVNATIIEFPPFPPIPFPVLSGATAGSSGSQQFVLSPGNTYLFEISIRANAGESGSASFTIIPTPGALTLLGVAGVVGRKRRRRD